MPYISLLMVLFNKYTDDGWVLKGKERIVQ